MIRLLCVSVLKYAYEYLHDCKKKLIVTAAKHK